MLGKSHGRRSLVGYSPWGRKESDTTEQLHFLSCLEGRLRPVQCVRIEQSMSGPFLVPGGQPSLWKLPLSPSSLRILRLCLQMSLYKVILLVSEGILFDLKNFALLQICWAGLSHCFLAISSPYCCDFQGREESDTGGQRFHPRFHIFFLFFLTLWFSVSHWGTSLTLFGKPSILLKSYQHILTSKSHFPLWLFHVLAHEFIL